MSVLWIQIKTKFQRIETKMRQILVNIDHRSRLDHTNRLLGELGQLLAEYSGHRAQLMWYPAYGRWRLVCRRCGDVVEEFPEDRDFPYPGRCDPPETLGVVARDGVRTRDEFGGPSTGSGRKR